MNLDISTSANMVRVEMPLDEFAQLVDDAARYRMFMRGLAEDHLARQEAGAA